MNIIVKAHRRHPGPPPGDRENGLRGPGAPTDSENSKFSKISRNLRFRLIRSINMSIYKATASPSDGRQITFTCSILLIIEATAPGNHIFVKTEDIPVFAGCLEAVTKKSDSWYCVFSTSTEWAGIPARASWGCSRATQLDIIEYSFEHTSHHHQRYGTVPNLMYNEW